MRSQRHEDRKANLYRSLLRRESKIGGELFGPLPEGTRREFFCLDKHTWIWHEEWLEDGERKIKTTRYDVRPDGVLKAQDGQAYQRVSYEEAKRLTEAAQIYRQRVHAEVYDKVLYA
jgi:hypothetical protein